MTTELKVNDVQDGAIIVDEAETSTWPECLMCRHKLVIAESTSDTNIRAACGCGVWTSGVVNYVVGSNGLTAATFRVEHPWGMSAIGRSFADAVSKIVL